MSRRGRESATVPGAPARRRPGRWYRLTLEGLEDRVMLSQVNWINPVGGDWDTGANWSTGAVPTARDDVVIDVSGGVLITHTQNTSDSVNSVTASDPITLSGGTLSVAGTFSDSSAVTLSGGTLANATVQSGTTINGSGALSNVTLDGTLDANVFGGSLTITNGLTLRSGLVETTDISSLNFSGTQTLGGSGEVLFNDGNNPNNRLNDLGSATLTIGSGITIDGLTATISADGSGGAIDNYGTLSVGSSGGNGTQTPAFSGGTFTIDGAWTNEPGAKIEAVNDGNLVFDSMGANDSGNIVPSGVWTNDAGAAVSVVGNSDGGGSLSLEGNGWSNAGMISMTNSSVYLGGTLTLAALGKFSRSGGTVYLAGTLNNTGTLALNNTTGSWELDGGTIDGGIVTTSGAAMLQGFGTLSGITLDGTLDANVFGGSLTITNGLTLGSGLVETTDISSLNFSGKQTLGGSGEVLFNGGNNPNNRLNDLGSATLTIGPHITIDGLTATIDAGGGAIDNFGTLSVGSSGGNGTQTPAFSGGTFTIDGAWTNEPGAKIEAVNDGNLVFDSMGANDSGNIVPSGVWTNDAGAAVSVVGNSDGGGSLSLEGNGWSNAGMISMTNSSVYLGGTLTLAALGKFSRSGGTVYLAGTLNNTGTLALNNTTGSWELDGGTIDGGIVTTSGAAMLQGFGTLSDITLDGIFDANVFGGSLTITNGLTLGSGLVETTDISSLNFSGKQTLGGSGEVLFNGGNNPNNRLNDLGSATLTIGSGITIDGLTATISADGSGGAIDNYGTLSVGSSGGNGTQTPAFSGGTFTIDGAWTNEPGAKIEAVNDGNLVLDSMGANDSGNIVPSGVWTNDAGAAVSVVGNSDGGGSLSLEGNGWSNAGMISMTNSSVYLGGTLTLAALGKFSRSGGTVYLAGTLNNTGTLALNNTTGSWELAGGTIVGGTITTAGTALLEYVSESGTTSTLNAVTLAGELEANGGSSDASLTIVNGLTLDSGLMELINIPTVNFNGTQTLAGNGEVLFNGSNNPNNEINLLGSGSVLTIGPKITIDGLTGTLSAGSGSINNEGTITDGSSVDLPTPTSAYSGGTLILNGAWTNNGTMQAINDGSLTLNGAWTNNADGTIEAVDGGSVELAGSFSNAGSLVDTNGFIYLEGTLNNSGQTLALTSTTGSLYLRDGTISGGTVSTAGGAELIAAYGAATLAGVTLAGTLDVAIPSHPHGQVTVTGGLALNQGTVTIGESGDLTFEGTQSLSGTGTLTLDDEVESGGHDGIVVPTGTTLTIAAGITVQGNSGAVGGSGGGPITNQGTIEATGGGTLTVQGDTNFAAGTLTGGTWGAVGGSTLDLVGANINTNAANIILDGASSQINSSGTTNALAGLVTNAAAGNITIQNGANFTSSQAFTNAGTLTINSGGTFVPGGTGVYTQTGGTTILSSGTLGIAGNQINIKGGTLSGPGIIDANLTNAGEVDLGVLPGTLTVNGNYRQASAGALALKVGGATAGSLFDQVNVSGTAALDGTLNVALVSGFAPALEEVFNVLNFTSATGAFSTFNSPRINSNPAFATDLTPASLELIGATTAPDLAVSNVTFTPVNPLQDQNVAVRFTVTNLGTVATTAGSWTDSVYLSLDGTIDNTAVLLGRVTHTGNLSSQAQYTATLTAAVPGLAIGSYHVIVVADSGLVVPDTDRANSTGLAPTELSTQPPSLAIGTSLSGTIANGQDLYYRLNATPGTNVELNATFAVDAEADLFLEFGSLPTYSSFDQSATDLNDLKPELLLPSGQGGAYYVWLHGGAGAGAGEPFTILATLLSFSATAFTPSSGENGGQVTMDVTGSGFTPQTTIALQDGGTNVSPLSVTDISGNALNATFDLTNASAGNYQVVVTNAGQSSTAPGTFAVIGKGAPTLIWSLQVGNGIESFETNPPPIQKIATPPPVTLSPAGESSGGGGGGGADVFGPAAGFVVALKIVSYSDENVSIPAFEISVMNATPDAFFIPAATLSFDGIDDFSAEVTPNPLLPGTSCPVSIQELSPQVALQLGSPAQASQEFGPTVPAAAWPAVADNLVAANGSTVGSLDAALQADAIYLAQVGDPVTDSKALFNFELLKAEDSLAPPVQANAVDSDYAEPGIPLTFARSFMSSLPGRYTLGTLGYGWTSNWDISAAAYSGDVYIQEASVIREFKPTGTNGAYTGVDGDQGVLTLSQGSYTLREVNGTITAFLPDGQLNYVQDANGNRITARYNSAGQMTSLTADDGDAMTLSYNAQGLLRQVTNPAGDSTDYTYDANEQLTSATNSQGTTQYTYVNGQAAAQEHALASVTTPDGTQILYSYDAQGRLTLQRTVGGGSLAYAYLSPAGYTVTDASGAKSTILINANGQPAVVTDPLGNVTRTTYNALGQALSTTFPGGTATSTKYGAENNVVSEMDALGSTSQLTTNTQTDELESYQNANGDTTGFTYTSQGDLASVTQPLGTASHYFYNAQGQVTESVDAEGRATDYTYDSHGRLVKRKNPDGTTVTMSYDAANNLLSITDASGTITMTYDAANRLTRIAYPDGQWLTYTYNSVGQMTQLADQGGFIENFIYNSLGQLSEVTNSGGNLIASYTYDLEGQLVSELHGNGTLATYKYDADGNLIQLVNYAPNMTVNSTFTYTYNALGLATSVTTTAGTTTYGYDADGQLTSVELPTGETITYRYDAMGNRTVVSDEGASTAYTTNSDDEYTSVGNAVYSFDANGNLKVTTGPGGTTMYLYDDENRLIEVKTPTDTWTYQYDALGDLASSTHNGVTTQYLVNPAGLGSVVAEYDGSGSLIANFAYGDGLTSQVSASGTAEYYDFDGLGSTVGLSGPSGKYVASYTYFPFGQVTTVTGSAANPFQFNGQSGVMTFGPLDYMRARFYSPVDGRFINRDPIGLLGGTNLYQYAGNNPVGLVDPSGLSSTLPSPGGPVPPGADNLTTLSDEQWPAQDLADRYTNEGDLQSRLDDISADNKLYEGIAEEFLSDESALAAEEQGVVTAASAAADAAEESPGAVVGGALGALGIIGSLASGGGATWAALGLVAGAVADVLPPVIVLGAAVVIYNDLNDFYNPIVVQSPNVGLSGSYTVVGPADPNSIYGPGGYGAQGFINRDVSLPYLINFDNEATANAPAQVVTVTQQLDPNLDWSTFQLAGFNFGGQTYAIPVGLTSYSTRIDDTASAGVYVDVDADFDPLTGLLTWTFTSLDPNTLDVPVGNPEEGFLPPDTDPPSGEGFIEYSIAPKASDPTGTVINARGTVIFQAGLPGQSSLDTRAIFNTIDAGPPSSSVTALPATSPASFTVNWSGQGDPGGSGIRNYDVYVSDDNGPFTLWQSATTQTSATYTGQNGHYYGFYSVATDNVGNVQPTPAAAQATTRVVSTLSVSSFAVISPNPRNSAVSSIDVTFSEPVNLTTVTGSALALTDDGGPNLISGAVTVSLVSGSTYQINGLAGLTTANGNYTLTVNAAGIQNAYGKAGTSSLSTSWLMDTTPPTSTISALPPRETSLGFPVSVTGSDGGSPASGVKSYDIYASINGGAWKLWTNVPASSPTAIYPGQSNTTYSFYSIAHDFAGNTEVKQPGIEASTDVPDLTPPMTAVDGTTGTNPSTINTSTGTFTLNLTGSDHGGLVTYFEVFVSVDGGSYQEVGPSAVAAGPTDSSGNDHSTITYQGLTDGLSHTYSFYSVGLDSAGNLQSAPSSPNVTFANEVFAAPTQLQVTSFTVDHGSPSRSFVRYLDVGFNESNSQSGNDLTAIVNSIGTPSPDIQIYKYDLAGDASSKTPVPLTSLTILHVIDHAIEIDFGAGGIGGNPSTTTADGYYEVDIKLPDGQTSVHHFYRLLGDVDGDEIVDANDLNEIAASIGESSPIGWTPLSADVTGAGAVTVFDLTLATRSKGRALGSGLSLG